MSVMNDTHPSIEHMQVDMLRAAGSRRRLAMGLRMGEDAIQLSRRELRRLHPALTERQIGLLWVKVHYGTDMAARLERRLAST